LNKGVVPEVLVSELKAIGFRDDELPLRVEPIKEGEWDVFIIPEEKEQDFYPKEQKYYFIKKEGDKLNVYRYALIKRYVEEGYHETEVPNMVTYILADYRGYDTLGETAVIFTAGVAVILLLRRREKRPEER
jgi:multicomponent Na+:H+ antiporter subunit B